MNKFSNETFESEETLPDPAEELRQKTVQALYEEDIADLPEPSRGKGATREANRSLATGGSDQGSPVRLVTSKRVKRTEAEMIASLGGSALKEATYVAERVQKLEDKISELLGSVSQKAREHILNDFPHLSRY